MRRSGNKKICSVCKEEKFVSNYSKKSSNFDGLKGVCRECSNITSRKYYSDPLIRCRRRVEYLENREARKEYQRQYRKLNKSKVRVTTAKARGLVESVPLVDFDLDEDVKFVYHHVNPVLTVPIPKGVHQKFQGGAIPLLEHCKLCNEWVESHYNISLNNYGE